MIVPFPAQCPDSYLGEIVNLPRQDTLPDIVT
jgi:hypothetical protein